MSKPKPAVCPYCGADCLTRRTFSADYRCGTTWSRPYTSVRGGEFRRSDDCRLAELKRAARPDIERVLGGAVFWDTAGGQYCAEQAAVRLWLRGEQCETIAAYLRAALRVTATAD